MAAQSVTAANVKSSGQAGGAQILNVTIAAGVTVTQGETLYKLTDGSNTYGLCDANGASPAYNGAGIALAAGSPGQIIPMVVSDPAFITGATGAIGNTIWTSGTAGGITITAADNTTGIFVQVIGVYTSTTTASISFPGFQAGAAML